MEITASNGDDVRNFFEDFGVWQHAPVLTGSTKFNTLPDVKNIMVTGGAGFMCYPPPLPSPFHTL